MTRIIPAILIASLGAAPLSAQTAPGCADAALAERPDCLSLPRHSTQSTALAGTLSQQALTVMLTTGFIAATGAMNGGDDGSTDSTE